MLLINPPFQRLKQVYNLYFPLGLGYPAGSLKQAGFDALVISADDRRVYAAGSDGHVVSWDRLGG